MCTKPKLRAPIQVVRLLAPAIEIPESEILTRKQSDEDQDTNWAISSSENAATLAAPAKTGPTRDGADDSCCCSEWPLSVAVVPACSVKFLPIAIVPPVSVRKMWIRKAVA